MRKEDIATSSSAFSSSSFSFAEDEVSANGDKPPAGNEHFCGKLASSAFSSLSACEQKRERGNGWKKRERKRGTGRNERFDEVEAENSRRKIFSTRALPMMLFHRPDSLSFSLSRRARREVLRRVIQILQPLPLF